MSQVINWICLICITFLVLDIMLFFCKDVIEIINDTNKKKHKTIAKTKVVSTEYTYETKIAK